MLGARQKPPVTDMYAFIPGSVGGVLCTYELTAGGIGLYSRPNTDSFQVPARQRSVGLHSSPHNACPVPLLCCSFEMNAFWVSEGKNELVLHSDPHSQVSEPWCWGNAVLFCWWKSVFPSMVSRAFINCHKRDGLKDQKCIPSPRLRCQ